MTDEGLFRLFLFLHVLGAIIAFGPTFIFSIIGAMGGKEPAHANFSIRLSERISDRVVIPVALSMPITGLLAIYFRHIDLAAPANRWLGVAIVLYLIAISIAIFIQRPAVHRMVLLTSAPPPGAGVGGPGGGIGGPGPGAAGPGPGGPAGGPPSGPPPAILAAAREIRRNGSILGILIVVIVLLMVVKPQF